MGINDVKPPGGQSPLTEANGEMSLDSKRESSFAEAREKLQTPGSTGPTPSTLEGVTQFSRTALEDPGQLDHVVRTSVSALIDSGQSITGQLTSTEKKSLVDFLSADPLFRQQVEAYLRKVLV
jgi:hypothetical protein